MRKKVDFRFYSLTWRGEDGLEHSKDLTELEVVSYRLVKESEEPTMG